MSGYSDLYRAFAHLGLSDGAWNGGNILQGKGRWYLSDGHALLRVSRCEPDRIDKLGLLEPSLYYAPRPESSAKALLEKAEAKPGEPIGPVPDAWSEGYEGIALAGRFPRRNGGMPVAVDAHKLRLATYVTLADEMTAIASEKPVRLWRDGELAALVMPLRQHPGLDEWTEGWPP